MPRGRILNKKISYDEKVAELSLEASLLYTWCIPHLDVKGRIYATPEILKGIVVPYVKELTLEKIKKCLNELQENKLVLIYGDGKYIQFNGFFKNQDVREDREAPSEIPDPEKFLNKLEVNQEQVRSNSGVGQEQLPSKSGVTPGQSKYKVKVNINKDILSGKPDPVSISPQENDNHNPPYKEIVDYLNTLTSKKFKLDNKVTQRHIHARWKEGFRVGDFKAVIDKKCKQWLADPKMSAYLRPETLFGTKFESYLNEETVKNWKEA